MTGLPAFLVVAVFLVLWVGLGVVIAWLLTRLLTLLRGRP